MLHVGGQIPSIPKGVTFQWCGCKFFKNCAYPQKKSLDMRVASQKTHHVDTVLLHKTESPTANNQDFC